MSKGPLTLRTRVLKKGDSPPCINTRFQCRGCYGWDNLVRAAREDARWRAYPLHCHCTGLTVVLEKPSHPLPREGVQVV
jgi:hypothetical protein